MPLLVARQQSVGAYLGCSTGLALHRACRAAGPHALTPAAALLLLGAPSLWTCVNTDPFTICQATGDVCVTATSPHELLLMERDAETITVTPLRGTVADVAWNLIILRAADAMALARDQAERARAGQIARVQ